MMMKRQEQRATTVQQRVEDAAASCRNVLTIERDHVREIGL